MRVDSPTDSVQQLRRLSKGRSSTDLPSSAPEAKVRPEADNEPAPVKVPDPVVRHAKNDVNGNGWVETHDAVLVRLGVVDSAAHHEDAAPKAKRKDAEKRYRDIAKVDGADDSHKSSVSEASAEAAKAAANDPPKAERADPSPAQEHRAVQEYSKSA